MVHGSLSGFGTKFSKNVNYKKDQTDMGEEKTKIAKIEQVRNTHFLEFDNTHPHPCSFVPAGGSFTCEWQRLELLPLFGLLRDPLHFICTIWAKINKKCEMTEEMYQKVRQKSGSVRVYSVKKDFFTEYPELSSLVVNHSMMYTYLFRKK